MREMRAKMLPISSSPTHLLAMDRTAIVAAGLRLAMAPPATNTQPDEANAGQAWPTTAVAQATIVNVASCNFNTLVNDVLLIANWREESHLVQKGTTSHRQTR